MKSTISRLMLIILSAVLVFTGCSKAPAKQTKDEPNQPTTTAEKGQYPEYLNVESAFPVVKEGEEITISVTTMTNAALGGKTEDIWYWQFCEQKMNIKFDVEQIMDSAASEKKNLMFNSGDLRDIIFNMGITTSDLVTYGQIEKKLFDLNSLMTKELAPNMIRLQEEFPSLKASMSCPDGGMYTFPKIGLVNDPGGVKRLFINEEWLAMVDLPMPESLDDFYSVLQAFQEQDPSGTGKVVPLGGNFKDYDPSVFVLSALGFISHGLAHEPALRDGKVEIPCGSELYADYLSFMHKLYTEGLMDENFYTLDRTQADAQLAEKIVGVIQFNGPYLVLPEVNDFQNYVALSPVLSEHNTEKVWAAPNSFITGTAVMSAKASHPEVVMRFMDYIYSQEGGVYSWNGAPELKAADTLGLYAGWTINEDGNMIYPDVESGKYESEYDIVQKLLVPFSGTMGNRSDILNDKRVVGGLEPLTETKYDVTNGDHFYRKSVTGNILPYVQEPYPNNVYFTEEENAQLSDLKTVIADFVTNETAKFVTGANSLANLEKYYADLAALGFADYQALYEKAYDNYISNQ